MPVLDMSVVYIFISVMTLSLNVHVQLNTPSPLVVQLSLIEPSERTCPEVEVINVGEAVVVRAGLLPHLH